MFKVGKMRKNFATKLQRILSMNVAVFILLIYSGVSSSVSTFNLRHVGSTPIEIVVSWDQVSNAEKYILQRSTSSSFNPVDAEFQFSKTILAYGDTGHSNPAEPMRFKEREKSLLLLSPEVDYYYRVFAYDLNNNLLAESTSVFAKPDAGSLTDASGQRPVIEGDLRADIVLGQPNFLEFNELQPNANGGVNIGGVVVDKSIPGQDRLYILDANHNRVLGMPSINPDSGATSATIVLGQPNFESAACNGDMTYDGYPTKRNPKEDTLCFAEPGEKSPREVVVWSIMSVDLDGNLYVADFLNQRVLKYVKPFETNMVADEVWGQGEGVDKFTSNTCNKEGLSASSLCLLKGFPMDHMTASVHIDRNGNLWVVDLGNRRVLRYPKIGNEISKIADLVLGQDNFTTIKENIPVDSLKYLYYPKFVVSDESSGDIYVGDQGDETHPTRILKYAAENIPLAGQGGESALTAQEIIFGNTSTLPNQTNNHWRITSLSYDSTRHGLWIQAEGKNYLYNFLNNSVTKIVLSGYDPRGVDVDSRGNLITVGSYDDLRDVNLFLATDIDNVNVTAQNPLTSDNRKNIFRTGPSLVMDHGLSGLKNVTGLTIAGNQLVISDFGRLLFWNDYRILSTGQSADGEWAYGYDKNMASPRVDAQNRLWFSSLLPLNSDVPTQGENCSEESCLHAVLLPLAPDSSLVKSFPINKVELRAKRKFMTGIEYQDFIRFYPSTDRSGNGVLWIATHNKGVFRLVNINKEKDASRGPYVDVVLGRANKLDQVCSSEAGYNPTASTICNANDVRVDSEGNVWVVDKPYGEDEEFTRLLMFSSISIPDSDDIRHETVFGIPASKVYGTGGDFLRRTNPELDVDASPFVPSISTEKRSMILDTHYDDSIFPLVYLDYDNVNIPQFSLGDATMFGIDSTFDPEGNFYMGDKVWNRVLIYKKPLLNVTKYNHPPQLNMPNQIPVIEGVNISFQVTGYDLDGDIFTVSANGLPLGAHFDPVTRRFDWTPTLEQAGTYQITFQASDTKGGISTNSISITVIDSVLLSPSNLSARTLNTPVVGLTWVDNSNCENSFSIEQSVDGINYQVVGSASANTTSYNVQPSVMNQTLYYRVRAMRGSMGSDPSDAIAVNDPLYVKVVEKGTGTPLAFIQVSLRGVRASDGKLIKVQGLTDADGYVVLRNVTSPKFNYRVRGKAIRLEAKYQIKTMTVTDINHLISMEGALSGVGQGSQTGQFTLDGYVTSSDETFAIADAEIALIQLDGAKIRLTVRSGSDGYFAFNNLKNGRYRVVVTKKGYRFNEQTDIINNENFEMNFIAK